MLPRASLCLNIPKTGTTWVRHFFNAADWLELRRLAGLERLVVPSRAGTATVEAIKRHGPGFGNLTCRAPDHHAGYNALPEGLRRHVKLCALRDVEDWYRSAFLHHTRAMKNTLLSRAIRVLVHGEECEADPLRRDLLLRHRSVFLERFADEEASADALETLSVEFFLWFQRTIRTETVLRRSVGTGPPSHAVGFLTMRAITLLFADPARLLGMDKPEFVDHFTSGRYLRNLRCDVFLDFAALSDGLCSVMTGMLGYTPEIVSFLSDALPPRNASPEAEKPRVARALSQSALFAQIRDEERVYERYLLPLAGAASSASGLCPGAPGRASRCDAIARQPLP